MESKFQLLETGEKTKVISFRVSENVYKALESIAQETGKTVSAIARRFLLQRIDTSKLTFKPGDILSSGWLTVLLVNEETTPEEISRRFSELLKEGKQ